jgi:hypothetical protein
VNFQFVAIMLLGGGHFKRGKCGLSGSIYLSEATSGESIAWSFRRVSAAALRAVLLTHSQTGWDIRRPKKHVESGYHQRHREKSHGG